MSIRPNSEFVHLQLMQGILLLTFTAISWGGLLQIAKPILPILDPFWLNTIRYTISAPVFVGILLYKEGRDSLSFEGHALRLATIGTVGFAGFGIVTLLGLQGTKPEHAALIVSMMPLITAILGWLRGTSRISGFTISCMLLGLTGVLFTTSQGHPSRILQGQVGSAPLLVFVGVTCWAFYTQKAGSFPSWSVLRYTSLSCLASLPSFALIVVIATATGWSAVPDTTGIIDTVFEMSYIIVIATIFAMLSWNAGIRRLGPLNGVLFINLVPISAFAIGVLKGQQFTVAEWVGGMLVLVSLVVNNLYTKAQKNQSPEPIGTKRTNCFIKPLTSSTRKSHK